MIKNILSFFKKLARILGYKPRSRRRNIKQSMRVNGTGTVNIQVHSSNGRYSVNELAQGKRWANVYTRSQWGLHQHDDDSVFIFDGSTTSDSSEE